MMIDWIKDVQMDPDCIIAMEKAADYCPVCEGIGMPCSISVHLCDDETIRRINAEYRGLDKSTDVLSFPSVLYPEGKTASDCPDLLRKEFDDETDSCFLGDIVISVPHCYAQAIEYGHSRVREAAYLLVHGICHLMGYDHMEESERNKMRKMEENILSSVVPDNTARSVVCVDTPDKQLIAAAYDAMKNSYSPYSHFPVGAALCTEDGKIFTGCNIENASFGVTNCAERTAVFKAVSEGYTHFTDIVITADHPSWPCGLCRQVMFEFSPGMTVWITAEGCGVQKKHLSELLPEGFGPNDLN